MDPHLDEDSVKKRKIKNLYLYICNWIHDSSHGYMRTMNTYEDEKTSWQMAMCI